MEQQLSERTDSKSPKRDMSEVCTKLFLEADVKQ